MGRMRIVNEGSKQKLDGIGNKTLFMDELNTQQKIWQIVAAIPAGFVASYGQVAKLAGLPNAARQVGRTLKNLPKDTRLPWHRVINSQGKISLPDSSRGYYIQKQRLEAEGVAFKTSGKIDLKKFAWKP